MYQNLTRNNSVNIPGSVPKSGSHPSSNPGSRAPSSNPGSRAGSVNASAVDLAGHQSPTTAKGQPGPHPPPTTLGKRDVALLLPICYCESLSEYYHLTID